MVIYKLGCLDTGVCLVVIRLDQTMFVGLVNVNVGRCGQGLYKVKVGGFEGVFGTETGV